MRKLYLALALMASALMLRAADPELNLTGTGTEADPYLITSAADMKTLAKACNPVTVADAGHYAGTYFKLTADIDMEGIDDFLGIGTAPIRANSASTYYFAGIFDGGGHRIKNLVINGVAFNEITGNAITTFGAGASRKWIGVFGRLGDGAIVRNLIVDASCTFSAANSVGGIAGEMAQGSTIENCVNHATIICYDQNAGGITGALTTTKTGKATVLSNCLNTGMVQANNKTVGGIVGNFSYGTVQMSANTGSVSTFQFNLAAGNFVQTQAGGIVGNASGGNVFDCFNAGDVYATKERAGGIVGYISTMSVAQIKNCLNVGAVSAYATYTSGQILGQMAVNTAAPHIFTGCCYDGQLLNSPFLSPGEINVPEVEPEIRAFSTAELISGNPVTGLGNNWNYRQGYYPVPNTLNYAELDAAASTYMLLPQGNSAAYFVAPATLSTGTTASFAEASDHFSVNGSTVTPYPTKGIANGKLTLTKGSFNRSIIVSTFDYGMQGAGTEASPYLITNKADLMRIAKISIDARSRFTGVNFRMVNDIDMQKDTSFYGISIAKNLMINTAGYYLCNFAGTFDGNGHTISNLDMRPLTFDSLGKANNFVNGSANNSGFFGSLGQGAVVKNLTLDSSCFMEGHSDVGGMAGALAGAATIDNCHIGAHIKIYSSYGGGFFAYSATTPHLFPITITNSSFFGLIECNSGYVGGFTGYNSHADTKIINCVNTGTIHHYHFNDCVKVDAQVARIAGIAACNNGTIEGCASYGPIYIDVDPTCKEVVGVGGIAGQNSNSGNKTASLVSNFTSSQINITGKPIAQSWIGNILGNRYFNDAQTQGPIAANYCDTQLNVQPRIVGSTTPNDSLPTPQFHGLTTAELTSGTPIDSLASNFTFEKGYYPMPKVFAQDSRVRAAAATFFLLPENQTIRLINKTQPAPFNNVMPLTGSLSESTAFYVKDNSLRMRNDEGNAILTLTNGSFSTYYPLYKVATSAVESLETTDAVIDVKYYSLDGCAIARPVVGQTVIAVSTLTSGKTTVQKIIIK